MRWRLYVFGVLIFNCVSLIGYGQSFVLEVGLSKKGYPIDIEDLPRGGADGGRGNFYGNEFWTGTNVVVNSGIQMKKRWTLFLGTATRYNQLQYTRGANYTVTNFKQLYQKNWKFDVFANARKEFSVSRDQRQLFLLEMGIGFTNINSAYNTTISDTMSSGNATSPRHFEGRMLHFGPRCGFGYRYRRLSGILDVSLVEGPQLLNLSSLWIGGVITFRLL
jgi:hypothetical protein